MCGIAAVIGFDDKSLINKATLSEMTKEIVHRGPDDEGFYLNEWIGLGFRRLSILDLSYGGHQPMFDSSNNYVIIFNGEIYNYKSLKTELTGKHYKFRSTTDTEVLLNSYIEWGSDCLQKLEGMFAFIIYDKLKEEVFVARDHLGIKPFYYSTRDQYFFFGSEVKVFKNLIKFELNDNQLYEQFMYGYVSGRNTIFKNIYRVEPGTFMKFNKNGFLIQKVYYNVTSTLTKDPDAKLDYEEIRYDLKQSISKHTMSDVGYNVQLSGGIDSSYITAVLSKECGQSLNTFSVRLENALEDETKYQQYVSKNYHTIHHGYVMKGGDICKNYEKATWHYDIPMMHPSSILLMLLCEHSRTNSKVILTGEGSDELFGGYKSFKNAKILKYKIQYFLQKHYSISRLMPEISIFGRIKRSVHDTILGIDQSAFLPKMQMQTLFNFTGGDIAYRMLVIKDINLLVNKIYASFQTSYLNYLFERQDKMSMAMGVEARVPFSNHLLFDKLNRISVSEKLNPHPKTVLKKLAEDYFDGSFIYRKKNGFNLPLASWLRSEQELKPMLDLLTDKVFKERGFYNYKNILAMIDRHLSGKEDNSGFLTNLISFETWCRLFID